MGFTLRDIVGDLKAREPPPPEPPVPKAEDLCPRTGKVRHKTREAADEHLQRLATDRHVERLKKYRCWSCLDWHVGHVD